MTGRKVKLAKKRKKYLHLNYLLKVNMFQTINTNNVILKQWQRVWVL